jgi:hypothetical protein
LRTSPFEIVIAQNPPTQPVPTTLIVTSSGISTSSQQVLQVDEDVEVEVEVDVEVEVEVAVEVDVEVEVEVEVDVAISQQ